MKPVSCKQENSGGGWARGSGEEKGDTKRVVSRSLTGSCLASELLFVGIYCEIFTVLTYRWTCNTNNVPLNNFFGFVFFLEGSIFDL